MVINVLDNEVVDNYKQKLEKQVDGVQLTIYNSEQQQLYSGVVWPNDQYEYDKLVNLKVLALPSGFVMYFTPGPAWVDHYRLKLCCLVPRERFCACAAIKKGGKKAMTADQKIIARKAIASRKRKAAMAFLATERAE